MRVFIGLTEIAGYYRGLREGFNDIGVDSTFVDLSEHPFRYGGSDVNVAADLYRMMRKSEDLRVQRWSRYAKGALFAWALARFDVFIFGFGGSFFFENRDLPILKRWKKKVIFQFHGSDSRPPYIDGAVMRPGRSIDEGIALARARKESLRRIERYADVIINTPPQGHLHERAFVEWLHIGLPVRPARYPRTLPPQRRTNGPVRILHSPSDPAAKGSAEIARAVSRLKAEGLDLELVTIEKKPNSVVLDEIERCDLVIDQLYADYAMPGFATEAAWFGKPVIIGGYAKPLWDEILPLESTPPTHYCHPDQIDNAIRTLARDEDARVSLGRRAREFVERNWNPQEVARRYLALIEGTHPSDWLYHPERIRYWQGCGLHEDRVRELVRAFVDRGGVGALQLSDKPELERSFLEVCGLSK